MKLRLPLYYKDFKCIAEKCSDNCCIGWEIDIDRNTAEIYENTAGAFGERLRKNICEEDGVKSFVLCGERCPFLNDRNLCDIIINMGEDNLCHICKEHPRYYEWYGNVKEGGVGLCCEAAAALVLTCKSSEYYETDIPDDFGDFPDEDAYDTLLSVRGELFSFIENEDISFEEKVYGLISYAYRLQDALDNGDALPSVEKAEGEYCGDAVKKLVLAYEDLEPIDDSWTKIYEELKTSDFSLCRARLPEEEKLLCNMLEYYIWRYFLRSVYDFEVVPKLLFAVASIRMTELLLGFFSGDLLETYVCAAKLYSKQMEYSEDNLVAFCDKFYEDLTLDGIF